MEWGSRRDNVVTVIGTGEIRARANLVHIVLEVRTRGFTAADALEQNNQRERSVRARLRGVRIHEESIESSGVTFTAAAGDGVTLPGSTEPQGFVAARTLAINSYVSEEEMAELPARIAFILDEASDGGAQAGARQQVNLTIFRSPCITYSLENDAEARREALQKALAAAKLAGEETARSMGMELGDIQSTQVLELGALVQARWSAQAFGIPGLDAPRPPEAGRVPVRAVIAVTYGVRPIPRSTQSEHLASGRFTLESAESASTRHPDHSPELS